MENKQLGNESLEKKSMSIADWVAIINLVVVVVGGYFTYHYVQSAQLQIESLKVSLEKTKVTIDISKFINDLRPAVEQSCTATAESYTRARVSIKVNNIGAHRISLGEPSVSIKLKDTEKLLNSYFRFEKNPTGNTLPSKTSGSTDYIVTTQQPVDWSKVEIVTTHYAVTDQQVVNLAKQILQPYVDNVESLAKQAFTSTTIADTQLITTQQPNTNPPR